MKFNKDQKTVDGFGDEWQRFDQSNLDKQEQNKLFEKYFSIFPWDMLSPDAIGFDMGCGSGRWAKLFAPRVKTLHCIDPSEAIEVAKINLQDLPNCMFHKKAVDELPLQPSSQDFGYSLGVLHHIPDTQNGIKSCVDLLKKGAPFCLYLYYAFDNRPFWFRSLWRASNLIRMVISKLPHNLRYFISQIIAVAIYWPIARTAKLLEKIGLSKSFIDNFPLSFYRNLSFYTMRTDALDRFGTRLEKRFTKFEVKNMMEEAGLESISFSNKTPYWTAVGFKK